MFGGFRPPRFNDYYDGGYNGRYDDYDDDYHDYDPDDWVNQLNGILNQRGRIRNRGQFRGGLRRGVPNGGGLENILAAIFGVQPRNNGPMREGYRGRDRDRDRHRHRHHHRDHHRHQPRHRDPLGGQRRYNGRIGHVSVVKHHDRRDYARAYMARMAEYAGAILVEFNTYLGTLAEMDHLKRDYRRGTG